MGMINQSLRGVVAAVAFFEKPLGSSGDDRNADFSFHWQGFVGSLGLIALLAMLWWCCKRQEVCCYSSPRRVDNADLEQPLRHGTVNNDNSGV